ncbi:MAG: lipoate--protein ligase family protein [Planctomycetales bacterium]|nr:lipoate--protein ligase family protein [Planctomycetales bacterium]MBN8624646.1 lipoate--protein ligase family protein [Planctomycetota bacterium]
MFFLSHTCSSAPYDVALDEALLDYVEQWATARPDGAEEVSQPPEFLRVWEARRPAVVIGRSSSLDGEVDLAECRKRGVDVVRRTSGGAAVVIGPGCLMYSVVLAYRNHPELRAVDLAHRYVLERVAAAIRPQVPDVALRGTSDLARGERKFSGNSLRCRREALLYHGTLLYDYPLNVIGAVLRTPPRMPDYRERRAHLSFVDNLPTTRAALEVGLQQSFTAHQPVTEQFVTQIQVAAEREAREKFTLPEWLLRVP